MTRCARCSRLALPAIRALLVHVLTSVTIGLQYAAAPLPIVATFIVFITVLLPALPQLAPACWPGHRPLTRVAATLQASLIPITKGVTPDKAQQGIWTTKAEIYNGRLAVRVSALFPLPRPPAIPPEAPA